MRGTIGPNPKSLLSVTALLEAATGLLLLAAPSVVVELLLGAAPSTPVEVPVSRVAGVALLAPWRCVLVGPPRSNGACRERFGRGNLAL
jgi:hypothetical protein